MLTKVLEELDVSEVYEQGDWDCGDCNCNQNNVNNDSIDQPQV